MVLALNTVTVFSAIVVALIVVLLLVSLLLWAKAKLTSSGPVQLTLTEKKR